MRTTPATAAEVDSWLNTLMTRGHLIRADYAPDGSWIVQRPGQTRPWTLHHPVLALDYIEALLHEVRGHGTGADR